MSTTVKEFTKAMVTSATQPTNYESFAGHNADGSCNHLYLMDEAPSDKYHLELEETLDWWNDIEGYFMVNEKNGIKDCRKTDYEIPNGLNIEKREIDSSLLLTTGDRVMDNDYNVYKVVGLITGSSM